MLKTTQMAAGIMGGLWGVSVSLLLLFAAGQLGTPVIPVLLVLLSLGGLAGTLRGASRPTVGWTLLLWLSTLLALIVAAFTFSVWGVLYTPTVLLLAIASLLATVRARSARLTAWLEIGVGVAGGALGVLTATLLLTGDLIASPPQTFGRGLLGAFSLAALVGFALHAWLGSRWALLLIWISAGGLLFGAVIGFVIGGIYYMPAALLVMGACLAATVRGSRRE
ncbi:MAG: hypothetical protein EXR55_06150 [Dehalococcoidia bacterium]|nr:hypothetical protein [Dehalococcoidia bacterium]